MNSSEVLNNKGTQLVKLGKMKSAVAFFRRAINTDPKCLSYRTNLGIALSRIPGCEIEAAKTLQEVITSDPSNYVGIHALGVLDDYIGLHEDALVCYQRCRDTVGCAADEMGYSFDVATSLIRLGKWKEGWTGYECRRKWKPEMVFKDLPTWDGTKDKLVFAWAEQGLGDKLQFSRYVPWLAAQCKRVMLGVPAAMIELFQPFSELCDLAVLENPPPKNADYEIPLMSLPLMYGEEIPEDPGLIKSALNKHFFPMETGKKNIGICWAASPTAVNTFDRRIYLDDLVQLAGDPNRMLYSLQGDSRASQLHELGIQKLIRDTTPEIEGDWCATRDLIRALDAVVTVDTSVAHLAGIMGKPTFLLIGNVDTWRWTYNWYPTMKIIRQSKRGSWDAEVRLVDQLLDELHN